MADPRLDNRDAPQDADCTSMAERLLRQHDAVLATTADGYALVELPGLRFLEVNDALCALLGRTREQLLALTVPQVIDDDTPAHVLERALQAADLGVDRCEARMSRGDGSVLDAELSVSVLPGEPRLVGFVRDVTEKNRNARELALRNRVLGIFLREPGDGFHGPVMEALLEATGSTMGLFTILEEDGTLVAPWLTPDVHRDCRIEGPPRWPRAAWIDSDALWARALRERKPQRQDGPGRVPDGHVPILRSLAAPIVHGDKVLGMVQVANRPTGYSDGDLHLLAVAAGQIAPVLDARRAQQRTLADLQQSEQRFRDIAFASADWLWEIDGDGVYTYSSPQVRELLGYAPEEVVGRSCFELVVPGEETRLRTSHEAWVRSGHVVRDVESWHLSKDGRRVRLSSTAVPLRDEAGRVVGMRGLDRDFTEKRRVESETLKLQKLESLGVMAGGIAHDFNNILTAVLGNVALARSELTVGGPAASRLADAERALLRAQDLTRQLLTFARGGAPVRRPSSMGAVVAESAAFVLSGSNCRSAIEVPADLWTAEVDPGQISQVVQNLVLNAVQAMPNGGTVRVAVDNVILGRDAVMPVPPGRYVQIDVEDDGMGIPDELAERVFEPYFTTKARGSGLGLSVSHSIVRQHQGHLWFDSTPGQGTAFHVVLPARDRPADPESPAGVPRPRGRGRLLVLDDEPMVRDVLVTMLAAGGFEGTPAGDGAEALRIWNAARQAGKPFDAVLLDLTVQGGMGGLETLDRMRETDPGVRAIVSSGYSTNAVMSRFRQHGFRGVLTKPFRPHDLHAIVEEVLQEPA